MAQVKSSPAPVMRSALAPACNHWAPLVPPAASAEPALPVQAKSSHDGQKMDAPSVSERQ